MIVAVAIGLALLIQAFLVKPYRIPSESMEPTLDVGQRVLVSRVNYKVSDPDRGDVVVFHPPKGAESNTCGAEHAENQLCPRPDGGADRRQLHQAHRRRAGRHALGARRPRGRQRQGPGRRRRHPALCTRNLQFPRPIKIPPGHFFMMGDNRGASDDSRFWGPVPEEWIIGQAFFTYWPPDASASSNAAERHDAAKRGHAAAGAPPPAVRVRPRVRAPLRRRRRRGRPRQPGRARWSRPRCCSTTSG